MEESAIREAFLSRDPSASSYAIDSQGLAFWNRPEAPPNTAPTIGVRPVGWNCSTATSAT